MNTTDGSNMEIPGKSLKGSALQWNTTELPSSEDPTLKPSIESKFKGNVVPQFINFTDSVSLDKSARTQVRAQVMRDYHRRRIQGESKQEVKPGDEKSEVPPPSAKSQTRKFRLGREKVLRPWVPVKTPAAKRSNGSRGTAGVQGTNKPHLEGNIQRPKNAYLDAIPQRETVEKSQLTSGPLPGSVGVQHHLPSQEPLDRWLSVLNVTLESSLLQNSPGSGAMDPFSSMSLLITPRTQLLLHNYFNVRLHTSWLMMPMRKSLFSRAIHDTAMFHSFLAHYADAYNVGFKRGDSAESTFHISMSAKLVNQRLVDPSLALTDDNIATVANLAAYECSNGSAASMVVHMDGLERMVQMRGGIFEGGFSPIVQRMIGWTDFHVATALLRKPRFPPLRFADTDEPTATSPTRAQSMVQVQAWPRSRLDILLVGVHKLSDTLKELRLRPCMPQENIWYSDKIYHLQRSLFDIAHCTNITSMNATGSLDALCSLAALIYCGRYLRDIPLSYAVTAHAVTRLKAAIEKHEALYLHPNSQPGEVGHAERHAEVEVGTQNSAAENHRHRQNKTLWVLAFGSIAAEGKREHDWFVDRLAVLAREMQLRSWMAVRECLARVLWQEELDEAGARLWEMVNLKTSAGAGDKISDEMERWVEF